jgi:Tol biopolymer transport system component
MKADGAKTQPLSDDPAQEAYPDWSPDGLQLVFSSDKAAPGRSLSIYLMSRKTKESIWGPPTQLATGWNPKWSPDGRLIVYLSLVISQDVRGNNLRVIPPSGGESRMIFQIGRDPTLYRLLYAIWSPDSRTVYFKTLDKDWHSSIWSVPLVGGEPRLLVRLVKLDDPYMQSVRDEFATDGRRFYFTATKFEADIWQADLSAGK